MITVSEVSKGFGGRLLFDNVNVAFAPGVNYGLTGPNGSGKSTFMKLLIGALDSDKGVVSLPARTAWLRQDHGHFDAFRVLDVVIMGNKRLWDAISERDKLYEKEDFTDADGERAGDLEAVVMEEDGYTAEPEAATLLAGLGIPESMHEMQMADLQEGLKLRVLLAQALFGKPDALLLDEPTNHLDLQSIRWLEAFLLKYRGVLVVISHDRRFLNEICDQIADIDYETIILYPGNYDGMVRQKAAMRGRQEKESQAKEKRIEQLQSFIQRFGAGTRASQTRSRKKEIEKLRPEDIRRSNIARPFIRFAIGDEQSGRNVVEVSSLSKSYGDLSLFSNFHTLVERGEKIAILGANGIGKSSLLNTILGRIECDSGDVAWGHNVRLGVMEQNYDHHIAAGSTVYDWLFSQKEPTTSEEVRATLGRMLFSGEDGGKPTGTLSGGEKARLMMCKLILCEYNVLFLDEPTNHLDLESISALGDAIEAFKGTVFYVTHDRDLASRANRIFAFPEPNTLLDYKGTVDEYTTWYDKHMKNRR